MNHIAAAMATSDPVKQDLHMNREVIRQAVMHSIFCPKCKKILDQKKAVYIHGASLTYCLCPECYDLLISRGLKAERFEIIDSRRLYP